MATGCGAWITKRKILSETKLKDVTFLVKKSDKNRKRNSCLLVLGINDLGLDTFHNI